MAYQIGVTSEGGPKYRAHDKRERERDTERERQTRIERERGSWGRMRPERACTQRDPQRAGACRARGSGQKAPHCVRELLRWVGHANTTDEPSWKTEQTITAGCSCVVSPQTTTNDPS